MFQPLISVIITSYNRAEYIADAIESALSQDYSNFEVVISDNASSDNTDEIISRYISDPRIRYFRNQTNIGMIPNFKKATEKLARGEYITFISSDDYLTNDSFLSESIELIEQGKAVLAVFSKNQAYNTFTKLLSLQKPRHSYVYDQKFKNGIDVFFDVPIAGNFGFGGAFYNRELFISLDPFKYELSGVDALLNFLLMLKGNIGFISKPTYTYRIHAGQASELSTAKDIIANFNHILIPFQYAKQNKLADEEKLEQWKNDLVFRDLRHFTVSLSASKNMEYKNLLCYAKMNHLLVYKKLKRDIKWNIIIFFFKRPKFSIKFFKIFSKKRFEELHHILESH